jgi:hypothetical protein
LVWGAELELWSVLGFGLGWGWTEVDVGDNVICNAIPAIFGGVVASPVVCCSGEVRREGSLCDWETGEEGNDMDCWETIPCMSKDEDFDRWRVSTSSLRVRRLGCEDVERICDVGSNAARPAEVE